MYHQPNITLRLVTAIATLLLVLPHSRTYSQRSADTATINQLLRTANVELNPDTAIREYDSILALSIAAHYPDGAFTALITKGIKYFEKQDYERYRSTTYEALKWAEQASAPDAVAWCWLNIGEAWFYQGNYKKANELYYKGLSDLNSKTDEINHTTVNAYNCLGLVNMRLKQYHKALGYYNRAEAAAKQASLPYQLAISYENKGVYFLTMNEPDSAEKYFKAELAIGKSMGKVDLRAFALAKLGKTFVSTGRYNEATLALKRAISLAKNRFNPPVVDAAFSLSKALSLTGQHKEAEEMLLWAYAETISHNSGDNYINCYKSLADLYRKMGQHEKALIYYDTLLLVKDSLMSADEISTISNLEIKYKAAEKEKALAQSRLLIEKQSNKIARKNTLIVAASVVLFLVVILFVVAHRNQKNKQKLQEQQLKALEHEHTIEVLNARMDGEDKERARLARELHDGIGGMLSAATMRFSTLPRHAPDLIQDKTYQKTMQLLNSIGDELRITSHNLMPDNLVKQTLPEAIKSYCNSITTNGNIKIDCQYYGSLDNIDEETKLNLYRVAQELIKNTLKHAQATRMLVQLTKNHSGLTLTVEDNGIGFDTGEKREGIGLANIKARVQHLNGTIEIKSRKENGTFVHIELSLA